MTKAAFNAWDAPFDAPREQRSSNIENPAVPLSSSAILEFLGLESGIPGISVNVAKALTVPAFFAAVNFLSGTLAGLPLSVYERTETGRVKVSGGVADVLGGAVNEETTSFMWRKSSFDQTYTEGRSYTYVEKDRSGTVINLWPLEYSAVTPRRVNGRKVFDYRERGKVTTYKASEIIDIPMMLKPDSVRHYRPVHLHKDTLGLALAVTKYGARFFSNGGVPPFSIEGPFKTAAGRDRAEKDMTAALVSAANEGRSGLAMPDGHKLTPLGFDPTKMQMVEIKRFLIEEIARIYSLPMVFLQDLTRGTFSNTEQQDLHLVKHTIKRWVEQVEQELNLKLFGRGSRFYVRFNLDGLMRGDIKTRMEAFAIAIQNAIRKPNEVRRLEELEDAEAGDDLLIQGATVPLKNQSKLKPPNGGAVPA